MFKKAHSSCTPTSGSPKANNFTPLLFQVKNRLAQLIRSRPITIYIFMLTAIITSICCYRSIPRPSGAVPPSSEQSKQVVKNSLSNITVSITSFREILELQGLLAELQEKKQLDSQDSLLMETALERIHKIEQTISTGKTLTP